MKRTTILAELLIVALIVANFILALGYYKLNNENQQQTSILQNQAKITALLTKKSNLLEQKIHKIQEKVGVVKATVTAYSPCVNETDSTPNITAFMKKVQPGGIAVSRDLLRSGWTPGKRVYIEGYGIFKINDIMNSRWEKRFDIFYPTKQMALNFGVKENIAVVLIHEL